MIRKIKVTDYPRLIEIWESAVLSTHDFLKEEDVYTIRNSFRYIFSMSLYSDLNRRES